MSRHIPKKLEFLLIQVARVLAFASVAFRLVDGRFSIKNLTELFFDVLPRTSNPSFTATVDEAREVGAPIIRFFAHKCSATFMALLYLSIVLLNLSDKGFRLYLSP
jgi:hypothetical protein